MRTLEFSLNGQRLRKAPGFSFEHIIKGSKNYLKAHFSFNTDDWSGVTKVAVFKSKSDPVEYIPIGADGYCNIPNSVTDDLKFTIQVIGVDGDKRIPTNDITITQEMTK